MKRILFIMSHYLMCGDLQSKDVDNALLNLRYATPTKISDTRIYYGDMCIEVGPTRCKTLLLEHRFDASNMFFKQWLPAYGNKVATGGVQYDIDKWARSVIEQHKRDELARKVEEATNGSR